MAGIYIHIPFCKTRCIYCGFYSTTLRGWGARYVDSLIIEHRLREGYIADGEVQTVYVGGGTPSQLDYDSLRRLLDHFAPLAADTEQREVTVECNPDDVTPALATLLYNARVNRVSMGVQTFDDARLAFLSRRHTARQAMEAVATLREAGIGNVSIDLMFGFPGETLEQWHRDIDAALALGVEHISAYSLAYEEGTTLRRMLDDGEVGEADEEVCRSMYYHLVDRLTAAGYEHYEISNFARQGFRSRHNSSYWDGTHYLGLGAGAHSYNGTTRQWNVADVKAYVEAVEAGQPNYGEETIDSRTAYNDMITTGLRTAEGVATEGYELAEYMMAGARRLIDLGLLELTPTRRLRLTRKGLYTCDDIMSELIKL